jgi:glycosyltransferase involved in cell wall biosynthesis
MKIVFISPCFNAAKNIHKLVGSTKCQSDDRWSHIIIDDMSEDATVEVVDRVIVNDSRYELIINNEKKYALRNIVESARKYQDEDDVVIAVIDGDDQLCNNDAAKIILDAYKDGAEVVWTAHRWDMDSRNISKNMPNNVNPYYWPWCTSHLRTFKSSLLRNISDENFKDMDGNWFQRGYDQALMLPVLSLTEKRKYIEDVCYLYNIDSVSVNDRDWAEMKQISTINMVRARGFLS